MHFTAHHHGTDKLGLAALLEVFANDQWIGEHYTEEQAVEAVMDRFRRLVLVQLELLELRIRISSDLNALLQLASPSHSR